MRISDWSSDVCSSDLLGGSIDRHCKFGGQTNDRGDIDDRARSRGGKTRSDRAREARDRRRVEADEPSDSIAALVDESAGQGAAGIVDEDADACVIAQTLLHGRQIVRNGQIGLKDIDRYAGFLA